jgi:hypothetical protein
MGWKVYFKILKPQKILYIVFNFFDINIYTVYKHVTSVFNTKVTT